MNQNSGHYDYREPSDLSHRLLPLDTLKDGIDALVAKERERLGLPAIPKSVGFGDK